MVLTWLSVLVYEALALWFPDSFTPLLRNAATGGFVVGSIVFVLVVGWQTHKHED